MRERMSNVLPSCLQDDLIDHLSCSPEHKRRLHLVASAPPTIFLDSFAPNGGRGCRALSPELQEIQLWHALKSISLGLSSVLPFEPMMQRLRAEGIPVNLIDYVVCNKVGSATGRCASDLRQGGVNDPRKKALLAERYSPMLCPSLGDVCDMVSASIAFFTHRYGVCPPLFVNKKDVQRAHQRQPLHPLDSFAQCHSIVRDGQRFLVVEHVQQFGDQESVYKFEVIGSAALEETVSQLGIPPRERA